MEDESRSGDTKSAGSIIGDEISFNGKQTEDGYISYTAKTTRGDGLEIKIQYYAGSQWKDIKAQKITNRDASYNCTIPENDRLSASKIRFINVTKYYVWPVYYTNTISNICVRKTAEKSLTLNGTAQFATKAGFGKAEQLSTTINLDAVNLGGEALAVSCTNDTYFSVSAAQINVSNSDCEGVASVTLNFNTTTETPAGDYNTTVTISHTSPGTSVQIPVTASVTEALISSISWEQSFTNLLSINHPEDITLDAIVVDPQGNSIEGTSVSYYSEDNNVVSITNGILHIVGDGRTTITATYTSDDEEYRTSSSNTKQVFVSDGSVCETYVIEDGGEHKIGAYNNASGITYTLDKPYVNQLSFDIWKDSWATTQNATITCRNEAGTTLFTKTYTPNDLGTSLGTSSKQELEIPKGTRTIMFQAGGTQPKYFKNVLVEQATYLEAITTSLGDVQGSNSANATINFKYSNLPTAVSASLKGNSDIDVSATPVGTGCGDWNDNATINLVFTPKTTGERQYIYNGNVILSAGAGEGLKTIKIPVNITISMPFVNLTNGYAMFYNEEETTVDANAYYASWTEINGGTALELIPLDDNIPAQTPVLLHNTKKDFYTFNVVAEPINLTLAPSDNAFVHTTSPIAAATDVNNSYYVLANKNDKVAFYKFTGNIPASKVVLVWNNSTNQSEAPARFDLNMHNDLTTALVPVYDDEQSRNGSSQIFTIMGVPVADMSRPGLYIVNGKKYIVR